MSKYVPTEAELKQVEESFREKAPKNSVQHDRIVHVRGLFKNLAVNLLKSCPPSRERSLAMTSLENSETWAVESILRNE